MATAEDRIALEEQKRALSDRLNRRRIQKARFGIMTDPLVDSEIDDLTFSIETINRQLDGPQLLPEARQAIERYAADNLAFVLAATRDLAERQTKTEERVKRIDESQHAASDWRLDMGPRIETIESTQRQEKAARQFWGPVYRAAWICATLLSVVAIGFAIWLAVRP